jgi:hypothetical protein
VGLHAVDVLPELGHHEVAAPRRAVVGKEIMARVVDEPLRRRIGRILMVSPRTVVGVRAIVGHPGMRRVVTPLQGIEAGEPRPRQASPVDLRAREMHTAVIPFPHHRYRESFRIYAMKAHRVRQRILHLEPADHVRQPVHGNRFVERLAGVISDPEVLQLEGEVGASRAENVLHLSVRRGVLEPALGPCFGLGIGTYWPIRGVGIPARIRGRIGLRRRAPVDDGIVAPIGGRCQGLGPVVRAAGASRQGRHGKGKEARNSKGMLRASHHVRTLLR